MVKVMVKAPFAGLLAMVGLLLGTVETQALELPDGSYETVHDGARGILNIKNGYATPGLGSRICSGALKGLLVAQPGGALSLGQTMGNISCTLTLGESSDALARIAQGPGCSSFHGAPMPMYKR